METLVDRPTYVDRLLKWRDRDVVKIVTGVRRCGKSTVLRLFRERLLSSGVPADRIVAFDFENPDTTDFASWREVWNLIKPRLKSGATTYVFLDEVQRVPEFEKLVDGLYARKGTDVYVTGSNAYLLSGELATYLSGAKKAPAKKCCAAKCAKKAPAKKAPAKKAPAKKAPAKKAPAKKAAKK